MEDKSLAHDGGYGSRKLLFALFSSILILIASRLCPGAGLGEVVTGLVAVCGIYLGANSAVKWQAGNIERAKAMVPGIMGTVITKAIETVEKTKTEEKHEVKDEVKQVDVVEAVDDNQ
jgi:hypothetical protein